MPRIEFNNGQKPLEFTEFPLNEKNSRKINMTRGGKDSEGLWAAFSDDDLKKYDGNARSQEYATVCILMNAPIHFYPNNLWGVYMPVKFNGDLRPSVDINDLDGSPVFSREATEAHERIAKEEKKPEPGANLEVPA